MEFDATVLCSLLLRRECCSFSNGEYVKAGLAELEQWCYQASEEVSIHITSSSILYAFFTSLLKIMLFFQYAGSVWDELKHIRQAVGFLVRLNSCKPFQYQKAIIAVIWRLTDLLNIAGHTSKAQEDLD